MLTVNPAKRITANEALNDPWIVVRNEPQLQSFYVSVLVLLLSLLLLSFLLLLMIMLLLLL